MGQRILLLIPARFQSSRFPGKPLAKISGKTLIQRVYENCNRLGQTAPSAMEIETCVVTDSDEIQKHLDEIQATYQRVDDDVISGSERIHLAYERFYADQRWDLIVNVQGDEPLMDDGSLMKLIEFHLKSNFDITTIVRKNSDQLNFKNPNFVKVVYCEDKGRCLYFSRSAVPFHRDTEGVGAWYHHIGVYSYTPGALVGFSNFNHGQYENIEKLEQLRALENGLTIGAIKTEKEFIGVDTPQDIKKVEEKL